MSGHHCVIGERRDAQVVIHRRTIRPMQPVFATNKRTGIVRDGRRFAQGGATFGTGAAVPAAGNKDSDHVITRAEICHPCPNGFDHACRLMAQGHRYGPWPVAVNHRQI